jgi:signal transduction histidine kinase
MRSNDTRHLATPHSCLLLTGALLLLHLATFAQGPSERPAASALTPDQRLAALPDDSSRLKLLDKLANENIYQDSAKAIRYDREGLRLAKRYHLLNLACHFLSYWGETYMVRGHYPEAMEKFNEQRQLATEIRDNRSLAAFGADMGVIDLQQGNYALALGYFFECLRNGELAKDRGLIQLANADICVAYLNSKNYDKTIEYANRALANSPNPGQILIQTKALEMIAIAYIAQKKYMPARDSLLHALQVYRSVNNEIGIATMYTILADTYPLDTAQQLQHALAAQKIWERQAPDNVYSLSNLQLIGSIYASRAKFPSAKPQTRELTAQTRELTAKARRYLQTALDRATNVNARENIMILTDSLAQLEAFDGHYKSAFTLLRQSTILNDSIFSQDSKNKIASIDADHKVELSEKQLQINQLALSNQVKIKWLLISSLTLVLLILALIYRQSRLRKNNNASLSALNRQLEDANDLLVDANKIKNRFLGILNHDLRSPVAHFITLLQLREQEPELMNEQTAKQQTSLITGAAEELLDTMEELLIWSKGQMEQFQPVVQPYAVSGLFDDLRRKFGAAAENAGVSLRFEQPAGMSVLTDEHFCKTMMRNLTGNALKALGHQPNGSVRWRAWEEGEYAWLSITDNGPGATEQQLQPLFDPGARVGIRSGLGLHIVRDMAIAVGCELQVLSPPEGGLELRLKMASTPYQN